MLSGFLIGTVPFWCGIRGNISKRIPSYRYSTFARQDFENMTGGIVLIAFGTTKGNERGDWCSLDGWNFFQPITDIGRGIIIKNRTANDDKIIIR